MDHVGNQENSKINFGNIAMAATKSDVNAHGLNLSEKVTNNSVSMSATSNAIKMQSSKSVIKLDKWSDNTETIIETFQQNLKGSVNAMIHVLKSEITENRGVITKMTKDMLDIEDWVLDVFDITSSNIIMKFSSRAERDHLKNSMIHHGNAIDTTNCFDSIDTDSSGLTHVSDHMHQQYNIDAQQLSNNITSKVPIKVDLLSFCTADSEDSLQCPSFIDAENSDTSSSEYDDVKKLNTFYSDDEVMCSTDDEDQIADFGMFSMSGFHLKMKQRYMMKQEPDNENEE